MAPLLSLDAFGLQSHVYDSSNPVDTTLVGSLRFDGSSIKVSGASEGVSLRLENVADPTADSDAANKKYVDDAVKGLSLKKPVRCASTNNVVTISSLIPSSVVDGVTLVADDRVLLRHQDNQVSNGIYVITEAGAIRADDFAAGPVAGVYCFVDEGDINGGNVDRSFICTSTGSVGIAPQEWVQFAARPEAYKGEGLKMGANGALDVDSQVVPYLATANTFTGATNTFTGHIVVQSHLQASVANVDTIPSNASTPSTSSIQDAWLGGGAPQYTSESLPPYALHATNWQYLYNTMNGLSWKQPVVAALLEDLPNGLPDFPGQVDGVTLTVGDRVLVAKQTTDGLLNGVYRVTATGQAPLVTRAEDMPAGSNVAGWVVVVMQGDVNRDKAFLCTSDASASTIGVHTAQFEIMGQSPEDLAGAGIAVSSAGTSLNVVVDGDTIEYDPGTQRIRIRGGVSNAVLGDKSNVMTRPVAFQDPTASVSPTTGAVTVVGGVGVTGNVHCQGVYNHSDERLKTNMVSLGTQALEAIGAMGGYTFTWRSSGQPSVGVMAQEVQAVAPLLVENSGEYLSVDYAKIVPYLIEAVKELSARMSNAIQKPRKTRARRTAQTRAARSIAELFACMR